MSINFNAYGIKSDDMNIRDLQVGQELIRVIRPRRYDSMDEITTRKYVVKKVLKTRLVVESVEGHPIAALPGQTTKKHELRLLVDQSSWKSADRRGGVSTSKEGDSESYNRTSYEFATLDEQELVDQMIAARAAEVAKRRTRNEAAMRVREIAATMHPELASVEAAILALQALADDMRAAQA